MRFVDMVDAGPTRPAGGGIKIDPATVQGLITNLLAQPQDKMLAVGLDNGDHASSIRGAFKRAEKRLDLGGSDRVLVFRKVYKEGKGPVKGGAQYEPTTLLVGWRHKADQMAFDFENLDGGEGLTEQDYEALDQDPTMQLPEGSMIGENLGEQPPEREKRPRKTKAA